MSFSQCLYTLRSSHSIRIFLPKPAPYGSNGLPFPPPHPQHPHRWQSHRTLPHKDPKPNSARTQIVTAPKRSSCFALFPSLSLSRITHQHTVSHNLTKGPNHNKKKKLELKHYVREKIIAFAMCSPPTIPPPLPSFLTPCALHPRPQGNALKPESPEHSLLCRDGVFRIVRRGRSRERGAGSGGKFGMSD